MKQAFETVPAYVKVCALFNYTVFCAGSCENKTLNCSTSHASAIMWTSLKPRTLTSMLFLPTAYYNWTVFGFEWGGVCDFRPSTLNINLSSQVLCAVNEEKHTLDRALRSLTKKVCSIHNRVSHQFLFFILFIFFLHILLFTSRFRPSQTRQLTVPAPWGLKKLPKFTSWVLQYSCTGTPSHFLDSW